MRQTHRVRQALHYLSLAGLKVRQFLDQICELTFLCTSQSDMMKNAQRGVNWQWNVWFFILYRPDYCPLNDLIKQLQQNMIRAGRCYEEFEEAAAEAIRTCTSAAEECKRKEREVRRRKEATKVVGTGLTAVGTVIAGTMGYFVAGPVGSYAMGVMAGKGGAYFTCEIVQDLEQSQRTFKHPGQQFEVMLQSSFAIKEEVAGIKTHLENVSGALDNVTLHKNDGQSVLSVKITLNGLSDVSESTYQASKTCSHDLAIRLDQLSRSIA